ncbi:MAG: transporter substrate-binding domain-containing protein [Oscillospiraceae bacterium]|jgi:polar amino acid transport system substrate-binding protein|nr:transporter substrate-binding domain-containing protein [Oscillospiraceae bacterium]
MKKALVILLAAMMLLSVAACGGAVGKLKSIQDAKKIVIYTDPNFSPFEFVGADEAIVGVDMEIAKAIAAKLGVTVEIKEAAFDSILTAIKGGKGDIALSGFTITEDRLESVDFSTPYIESVQYLILPESDDTVIYMEDLAGLNVGVAQGYSGQLWIGDELDEGGALYETGTVVKDYNSAIDATLDLKAGRINVVVMDEYVAKNIVDKNSGLKTIPLQYEDGTLASEEYGVMVSKGNEDLLKIINEVVAQLNADGKIKEWVVSFSE